MFRNLAPGRLLVDYGPISMVIEAYRRGHPLAEAMEAGGRTALMHLENLTRVLDIAKKPAVELEVCREFPDILNKMIEAVKATGEPDATPMAAVAGAIADEVLSTLINNGATRAVVNNGGDIAVLVDAEKPMRVGIITDLADGKITHFIELRAEHLVSGLATSGLQGRSLTKGIASAVVVLGKTSAQADACATMLANAVNAGHREIFRAKAETVDPLTDIKGQLVTLKVGDIDAATVNQALESGKSKFFEYRSRGLLCGVVMAVKGRVWMYPHSLAQRTT